MNRAFLPAFAIATVTLAAGAQAQMPPTTTYDVKTMNFDLWCQETAHIDPDRCDKRLPPDEQAFDSYRGTIEKYELSHLKDKEREFNIDQNLIHKDPIDEPLNTQVSAPTATSKNNP